MAEKQAQQTLTARQKALAKAASLKNKFKEHASTAIIAAFGFIIALSWKDLIVKLVDENVKAHIATTYPYIGELITAVVVTLISIIGIILISKWAQKPEEKK